MWRPSYYRRRSKRISSASRTFHLISQWIAKLLCPWYVVQVFNRLGFTTDIVHGFKVAHFLFALAHTGLTAQCHGGIQRIYATNIEDPYKWPRANGGCVNSLAAMVQHVSQTSYSTACLEKEMFSKLYELVGEQDMRFWTGICDDPAGTCVYYHRTPLGVTTNRADKTNRGTISTKYLLCENGKWLSSARSTICDKKIIPCIWQMWFRFGNLA